MRNLKTDLYPGSVRGGGKEGPVYAKSKRALWAELISGGTALLLSLFILGHLVLESSILLGKDTYDTIAAFMEKTLPIAQVLIFIITILFFLHFVYASRKIPARLSERKRMMELGLSLKRAESRWNQPKSDIKLHNHRGTTLWLWQVRTGMIVLAGGAFHLFLVLWNLFTNMGFAESVGLSAAISTSRVESGLWILYLVLGVSLVVHLSIGLYRLFVKWMADTILSRKTVMILSTIIFVVYILLNIAAILGFTGNLSLT